MAFIYQFADGTFAKGKYDKTSDIRKARVFRLESHALASRGARRWEPVEDKTGRGRHIPSIAHPILGEGDKLIELVVNYPSEDK